VEKQKGTDFDSITEETEQSKEFVFEIFDFKLDFTDYITWLIVLLIILGTMYYLGLLT